MPITGNKGEWSEIYTLFKLLGDGVVYAGDGNMQKISNLFYPIMKVIRQEQDLYEYSPNRNNNRMVIIEENKVEIMRISMNDFVQQAQQLLADIRRSSAAAFSVPNTEQFMNRIRCSSLKARSCDKADIHIVIHDLRTGMTPLLGFSIKSQLGSSSTLLNPGRATNFTYKLNKPISDSEISSINSVSSQIQRMADLFRRGYDISYHSMDSSTFEDNLLIVDSVMPEIVAECMKEHFTTGNSTIKDLTNSIMRRNPYGVRNTGVYYSSKMKSLLIDAALGMTPATVWTRKYDANGGYLVVRNDGEVVCYHFYDRNQLEDYLYNNTRLDWPSRTRYDWGYLYRQGQDVFLKLNLQIRFL